MRFELIFVRHGESCANVLLKEMSPKKKLSHKGYTDPELSQRGKALSEIKADFMKGLLQMKNSESPFNFVANPNDPKPYPYTLGASALLRAQETAYLMVGKRTGLPIRVFPYVGEIGLGGKIFFDNSPLEKYQQESLLKIKYKDVNIYKTFPSDLDARAGEPPAPPPGSKGNDAYAPPDFKAFLAWVPNHLEFFTKGEDDVYRAIIVSHSNFLKDKDAFPFTNCINKPDPLPHKEKLDNNDFLVSIFELGPPEESSKEPIYLESEAMYPKWHYFDTRPVNHRIKAKCGRDEKCRKPVIISGQCTQEKTSNTKNEILSTNPMYQNAGRRKTKRRRQKRQVTLRRPLRKA